MSFDKDGSRNPPKSRQSIAPQPNKKKRTSSETNAINEDRGGPERGPVIRHRKKVENEIGCDNSPHETKFKLRQPRVSHYFFCVPLFDLDLSQVTRCTATERILTRVFAVARDRAFSEAVTTDGARDQVSSQDAVQG